MAGCGPMLALGFIGFLLAGPLGLIGQRPPAG